MSILFSLYCIVFAVAVVSALAVISLMFRVKLEDPKEKGLKAKSERQGDAVDSAAKSDKKRDAAGKTDAQPGVEKLSSSLEEVSNALTTIPVDDVSSLIRRQVARRLDVRGMGNVGAPLAESAVATDDAAVARVSTAPDIDFDDFDIPVGMEASLATQPMFDRSNDQSQSANFSRD